MEHPENYKVGKPRYVKYSQILWKKELATKHEKTTLFLFSTIFDLFR